MRILLAPDSFKGSLSAAEVCDAMARGARRVFPAGEIVPVPLADGGEGTVEAALRAAGGRLCRTTVRGPLGKPIAAQWTILPDGRAVIEMAQASGLTLVAPNEQDALHATTFGTGELIRTALDAGCRELLIGIGGSATTDGGSGALHALGAQFFDRDGKPLAAGGGALCKLQRLDLSQLDARLKTARLQVLCDVTNPLHGPNGAAQIYAPQKGATPEAVEILDAALEHFADVVAQTTGNDLRETPGAGAAGGLGFGLMALGGAHLVPGIETMLQLANFAAQLEHADLVLTAEGALDLQTLSGKAIAGVCAAAQRAKNGAGVPVIAFGGAVRLSGAQLDALGVASAFALPAAPMSVQESMSRADELLADAVERALRLWKLRE